MNKKFQDNNVFINLAEFFENKVPMENYFDIIISMQSVTSGRGSEVVLASYCNIIGDKMLLGKAGANIQMKLAYQELNVRNSYYLD